MSKNIIFCDLEVNKKTKKINEIGLVYKNNDLKTTSLYQDGRKGQIMNRHFIKFC
jgi:hypothetical protein